MKKSSEIFLFIAIVFISGIYFITTLVSYENQIEDMKLDLDKYENEIDTLLKTIDTLNYRLEIWDELPSSSTINALIFVESSNNDSAYNLGEDAVGCLQIRRTMVRDINRILGKQKYTYNDRWSRTKSIEMLRIYCNHYNLNTPEQIARCWNGGPRGLAKPQTANYWSRVKIKIEENS